MPGAENKTKPQAPVPRTGVLLVNLGTPDAPTAPAVRRYLAEFLGDPRVVEIPRAIWLPILYGFILPFRPGRVASNYAGIWMDEGSPLLVYSRRLAQRLGEQLEDVPVELGMSYGNPSLDSALARLEAQQVEQVVVLPLYPQYSATTTAASFDVLARALGQRRQLPGITLIRDYHALPAYIEALASSVRAHWDTNGRGDHLALSFHGIPKRNVDLGDPYATQCQRTASLLADALGLAGDQWSLVYQSRFGKAEWLQPYADQRFTQLAQQGVKTLDVICPGFAADCLETLEEIAVEYGELFVEAGGRALRYIPALNDAPAHAAALQQCLQRYGI